MAADRVLACGVAALGLVFLSLTAASRLAHAELAPAPAGLVAHEIAARSEAALRGRRRVLDASMTFSKNGRAGSRIVRFRVSDDRASGRALLRILAPEKEAGRAFLTLPPNVWTWLPKDDRIARLPPTQWHAPFLGGGLDHDDLLHLSDPVGGFEHRLLGIDPQPDGVVGLRAYVIESLPKEAAGGAIGRIVAWIETEHATPLRREYYDAEGRLSRVLHFGDIREVQGRRFPYVWTARRASSEDHETRLEVEGVWFDPKFEPDAFSTQRLKFPAVPQTESE